MDAAGSHRDALESYQKAVALAPSRLIHRVELGRTLHGLGKKEQARQELEVHLAIVFLYSTACLSQVWLKTACGLCTLIVSAACMAAWLV